MECNLLDFELEEINVWLSMILYVLTQNFWVLRHTNSFSTSEQTISRSFHFILFWLSRDDIFPISYKNWTVLLSKLTCNSSSFRKFSQSSPPLSWWMPPFISLDSPTHISKISLAHQPSAILFHSACSDWRSLFPSQQTDSKIEKV